MAEAKKKKSSPTEELLRQVLDGQNRLAERLGAIETQQTLTNAAWQRQGKVIEEINRRCMDKLGIKCPLLDEDDTEASG